jgi:simple sugar transport system permease protein
VFLIPISILFVYGLLWKTPLGYNIRAVGISAKAAEYAGINPKKNIVLSMFISGGLAGTAGMIEITGVFRLMIEGISLGYGFYAITAGLLGKLNPFGVALAALLLSTISVGADTMQRTVGAPVYLVFVIQSLVLLFVILAEYVVRRSVD